MLREMIREGKGREVSKCQDCGNQAKKGCEFMRCRTCCNYKHFPCPTHINSTWVPTSSRRRHLHHQPHPQTLTHNNNPSPGVGELNKFPAVMSLPAVFRCVRVRSEDDTVDEYAYQTSVNIGGHVFSGVLYDQGPDENFFCFGQSSKGPLNLIPHHDHDDQHDHFMDTSMIQSHEVDAATTITNVPPLMMSPSSSSAEHFPSSLSSYPLSLATFRPPLSYFTHPKTS